MEVIIIILLFFVLILFYNLSKKEERRNKIKVKEDEVSGNKINNIFIKNLEVNKLVVNFWESLDFL